MGKPSNGVDAQISLDLPISVETEPKRESPRPVLNVVGFVDPLTMEVRRRAIENVIASGIFATNAKLIRK